MHGIVFVFTPPPSAGLRRFNCLSSRVRTLSSLRVLCLCLCLGVLCWVRASDFVSQVLPSVRGVRVLPSSLRVHALQHRLSASSGEKGDGALDEGVGIAYRKKHLAAAAAGESGRRKLLDPNAPNTDECEPFTFFSVGFRLAPCAAWWEDLLVSVCSRVAQ